MSASTSQPNRPPLRAPRAVIARATPDAPPRDPALPRVPRVAVIVTHGMGQQVPFETLEGVAYALRDANFRHHGAEPDVRTRFVRIGDRLLPCAMLTVRDLDGAPRDVHLYEVYWAPLTESKITLRETAGFLIGAGVRGFWRTRFDRMMFDSWYRFRVRPQVVLEFLAAVATLVALGAMNLVIAAAALSGVLAGGVRGWLVPIRLGNLSCDLALLALVGLPGVLLGVGAPSLARRRRNGLYPRLPAALRVLCWLLIGLALASLMATGADMGLRAATGIAGLDYWAWPGRWAETFAVTSGGGVRRGWGPIVPFGLVWGFALFATWRVRAVVVQFVGDVAIYVSSNTVDRFSATREAIQAVGHDVMSAVFGATRRDGARPDSGLGGDGPAPPGESGDLDAFLYDDVVVAGHSLGSVVAYDVLNKLLIEDRLAARPLGIARRTGLFLTFGSPLDKIAYLFRTQRPERCSVRESLAEARQPMIASYDERPRRWINLHSPEDWVGASLDYFDSDAPDPVKAVANVVDREATTPLLAHNEHWTGYILSELLYLGAIDRVPPRDELQPLADRRPIASGAARTRPPTR